MEKRRELSTGTSDVKREGDNEIGKPDGESSKADGVLVYIIIIN